MTQLRDVCLGIIELAHPDAKPTVNEDYRIALKRTGVKTRTNNTKESSRQTMQWGHLFKVSKQGSQNRSGQPSDEVPPPPPPKKTKKKKWKKKRSREN